MPFMPSHKLFAILSTSGFFVTGRTSLSASSLSTFFRLFGAEKNAFSRIETGPSTGVRVPIASAAMDLMMAS